MGLFVILLLVPIAIQHIAIKGIHTDYQTKNKNALAFFFAMLTFMVMFRHESLGNDTENYILFFERFCRMEWRYLKSLDLEVGFSYLNKIISLFSEDPRFFLAVTSILVSAMIYPTYRRLCTDTALTIALFCVMSTFVMMFSGIRQMFAVGMGFVAYDFVRKRKPIAFAAMVLLALSFHSSAFMLAFMYPLYHVRITKKWLTFVVPLLIVIYVLNEPIFMVLGTIIERYTKYDADLSSTGAYTMLILFVIFAVFAFVIPKEEKLDDETIGLRNFLLFAVVLQMFVPLHTLAMRMNYYYIIFIPLLMPKIIEARSKRWNQVAILGRHVMVAFLLLYFFVSASPEGSLHVFPYRFFWENAG